LIDAIWTAEPSYADPAAAGDGRAGIDAMVAAVQARFPGHRFRRTTEVDLHHDRLRFRWELAPEGGPVLVAGVDFGTLADGGRLASVTGFFDQVPKAA